MPRRPWTEADYEAKGLVSKKLRLSAETVDRLESLAETWGMRGIAEVVERLAESVDAEGKRRKK